MKQLLKIIFVFVLAFVSLDAKCQCLAPDVEVDDQSGCNFDITVCWNGGSCCVGPATYPTLTCLDPATYLCTGNPYSVTITDPHNSMNTQTYSLTTSGSGSISACGCTYSITVIPLTPPSSAPAQVTIGGCP